MSMRDQIGVRKISPTATTPMSKVRFDRRRFLLTTGLALAMFGHRSAFGQRLRIELENFQPIPIAIPDFVPEAPAESELAAGVAQVITNNLKRSGAFAPIDPAAFVERISNMDSPNLKSWKTANAQFLLTGRVTRLAEGGLRAEFRLWNLVEGREVRNKGCDTAPNNWRRIAHIISDQI